MSLPLYALGLLGAAYIDARHLIRDDVTTAASVARMGIKNLLRERRGTVNVFFHFEEEVKKRPNQVALIYPEQVSNKLPEDRMAPLDDYFVVHKWTYRELHDTALRYARLFRDELGIKPGDIVALDCMNNPDYVFVWLGLWSLGATPAFINYNLRSDALLHCIKIAGANVVLADPEIADNIDSVRKEVEAEGKNIVMLDDVFHEKVKNATPYRAPDRDRIRNLQMSDPAMFIYTSGTTGLPKSAVMSWTKAIVGAGSYASAMRMTNKDITYSPMPLYHSTGAVLGLLAIFSVGGAFAVGKKFSARTFWTQAKLSNATFVQYVGETCRYLLMSPPGPDDTRHGVKGAIGNGIRPDVWVKFKERFNLHIIGEFYGATEFPTGLTNYQRGEYGIGAVASYGSLLTNLLFRMRYTIAAVDPDDPNEIWRNPKTGFGRVAKTNEPGEFLFRIPDPQNIQDTFQGYHGNKKATEEKIIRNLFKKGDAYVRSGDLLKWDDHGLVYFVDRMGDTFRWKSENVSTNEVEEAFTNIPGIYQVVVVGVQVPNHEGRAGFAVIEPTDFNNPPDLDLIAKTVTEKLPKYAVPVFLKFTNAPLDSTGTNKVQKTKYRNQKIPHPEETIYWLKNNKYIPLEVGEWKEVEAGKARL